MKHIISSLATLVAISAVSLHAQVTASDPWVRATVPQQKVAGAFMQLKAEVGMRLVAAQSPIAGAVEIHEMSMDSNVMRMRAIPGIDIPAGQTLNLKPGGFHLMLIDLKGMVKADDVVPITLRFEGINGKQQTLEIKALARALNAASQGAVHSHHGHKH